MKLNKLIYILSIVLFTVSCEKDFLETYPTASLSQEQVGEALAVNDAAAEGTLLGIYEQLYRRGSGGSSAQEDFGVKAYDMYCLLYTSPSPRDRQKCRMASSA